MADARDLFGMNMLHAPRFFLMRRMNVDNDAAFLLVSANSEQVISEELDIYDNLEVGNGWLCGSPDEE